MSAAGPENPALNPPVSKSKKKNKKKRVSGTKNEPTQRQGLSNGTSAMNDDDDGEEAEEDGSAVEQTSPIKASSDEKEAIGAQKQEDVDTSVPPANGSKPMTNAIADSPQTGSPESAIPGDTREKLDALVMERNNLRAEVTELRKSLETIQGKHQGEIAELQEQLVDARSGKEHVETQYRNLLGKVNTIKSQLGERLKQDAEELAQARETIEELEDQNRSLKEANDQLLRDVDQLKEESRDQAQEITELRSRSTLSQQNWLKERDELIQREAYAREEFETAKQAMQDWEILAMEERSLRENLGERVAELEEQLSHQRELYERASSERETQSSTIDGLQRALQEIQNARKKELREVVENCQSQLDSLRKQLQEAEAASSSSKAALEAAQKELERVLPFEKEVKEKNLLIGKLKHEAVILNDHLTKALRMLKKGKPEDNVDRQIVSNYFLHFLAIDRSDPKKFEALQLIAALLNWNEEQREQAGLARPGASSSNLRIPISPFRRTPSTPSLSSDPMFMHENSTSKESLAELWSNFLEQEAASQPSGSRRGSTSTSTVHNSGNVPKP